jgi:3-hydroxymyristoyl/3-hydroxydecanoyl-(acyl carrier protein) dehydratase
MSALPDTTVLEAGRDTVRVRLHLPADLAVFDGHFPGQPVLPGVAQLDWAMAAAHRHLGFTQRAAGDFQVKFRNVVVPPAELTLELTLDRARGRVRFTWRNGVRIASQGSIAVDPP